MVRGLIMERFLVEYDLFKNIKKLYYGNNTVLYFNMYSLLEKIKYTDNNDKIYYWFFNNKNNKLFPYKSNFFINGKFNETNYIVYEIIYSYICAIYSIEKIGTLNYLNPINKSLDLLVENIDNNTNLFKI